MPASKPTSSGAVVLQTGHANYANLVRCFTFLDGSGTSITDHKAVGALTATIDAAGGGWQTSTEPYGFTMAHNNGSGDNTYWDGTHTYNASTNGGFTVFARVKVDSIDPTGSYSAPIFANTGEFASSEPSAKKGVALYATSATELYAVVGDSVSGGWRQREAVSYTAGQWMTVAVRYSYNVTTNSLDGTTYLFLNGVSSGTADQIGDRPGQFNQPSATIRSGKMDDASVAGWAGEFDVLYIYDAPLSDGDILALHNDPYAVISSQAAPVAYDENLTGVTANYVGGAPTMVVDGAGGGQAAGKPTSLGAIALQTSHALYSSMTHVWSFLDGSGTTITESRDLDSLADDNLTLTVNHTSTWQTSTSPYGFSFTYNPAGNNDWIGQSGFVHQRGVDFAFAIKAQVDAIDPDTTYAALFSTNTFNVSNSIRVHVHSNNTVSVNVGFQHGYRELTGAPYTLGTELRVIFAYDYTNDVTTVWVNGTKYISSTASYGDGAAFAVIGDKPGSFGTALPAGLMIGRNGEGVTTGGFTGFVDTIYRFNAVPSDVDAGALDEDFYSLITANSGSNPAQTYDQQATGIVGSFVGGQPLFSGHGLLANDTSTLGPLTIASNTTPANGSLTLNADGTGQWDTQGFAGTDSFTYVATDGTDNSSSTTVNLSVVSTIDESPAGAVLTFVGGTPTLDTAATITTFNQLATGSIGSFVGGTPGLVTQNDTTFEVTGSGATASFVAGRPTLNTSTLFYGFNDGNPYDVRVVTYTSSGTLVLGDSGESSTFVKQPNDVVLLDVMCEDALGAGELIQLVYSLEVVSATDGDLTSLQMDTDPTTNGTPAVNSAGDTIQTLLSAGTNGVTYKVRVLANTNFAPQKEFDFYVTASDI